MRSYASNSLTVLGDYAPPKGGFRLAVIPEPTAENPRRHRFTIITEPGAESETVTINPGDGSDPIEVKLTKEAEKPKPKAKKEDPDPDPEPPVRFPRASVTHDFKRSGEFDVNAVGDKGRTSSVPVRIQPMRLTMNLQPNRVSNPSTPNQPGMTWSDKRRNVIQAVVDGVPKGATVTFKSSGATKTASAVLNTATHRYQATAEFDGTRGGYASVTVTCDKYTGDSLTEIIGVPRYEEPIIASLSVQGAPANTNLDLVGGQIAIIEGTGLTGTTKVEFGTRAATDLKNLSDGLVQCKTPAGEKGKNFQDLTITATGGTFTKPRCFAYKDAVQ